MLENVVAGFIGAALALLLRWAFEKATHLEASRKLAGLCVLHLEQIKHDLLHHIPRTDGHARFGETQYHEVAVGFFLYDLITANLEKFPSVRSLDRTMTFFHHYKVNMNTVRARLDTLVTGATATLTNGTFDNLIDYLDGALSELREMRDIGPVKGLWRVAKASVT